MTGFFRLLWTGSRNTDNAALRGLAFDDGTGCAAAAEPRTVSQILAATKATVMQAGFAGLLLVHGACPTGADAAADRWARARIRAEEAVAVETWPANWADEGPAAGPRRNRHMVERGADACYALVGPCAKRGCRRSQPHGSHGADGCARLAEGAEIHVQRFEPFIPDLAAQVPLTLPESKE